jgi:hypothetical protein
LRCRHCDTEFGTVDPLTARDLRRRERREADAQIYRTGAGVMFGFSLFGCMAPAVLLVALAWFIPNRRDFAKAGPLCAALAYSALAISVLYCVLIVIFLVVGER